MRIKKMGWIILAVGFLLSAVSQGFAGEMDILVNKLVQKGILTRDDANDILRETREEAKEQASSGDSSSVPSWVKKTKLKGDFRLRYEALKRKGTDQAVNRGRIRYRLGVVSDIVDQVQVGAGLASGSDSATSARSTNQDMEDVFSTKTFSLDYAYVEYKPFDWMSAIAGKFERKKYLWEPSDLLWDTDINPEGGSLQFKHEYDNGVKLFANTGVWVLDESTGDTSDQYLYYIQPGIKMKCDKARADAKIAFTYYDFDNIKGTSLDGELGRNTQDSGNGYEYKFTPLSVATEVGFAQPFDLEIPRLAFFGEYVHNPDPSDENNGWLLGLKFGDEKVDDKNKWQMNYMYAQLQKDAFLDVFPDADRHSGGTDMKSHEGILQYGLNKNIMVELDYYYSARINATPKAPENVVQASANLKF